MAFDLLYSEGCGLTTRPLHDRRVRLENIVAGSGLVFPGGWHRMGWTRVDAPEA